jgi:hypothetical protein
MMDLIVIPEGLDVALVVVLLLLILFGLVTWWRGRARSD